MKKRVLALVCAIGLTFTACATKPVAETVEPAAENTEVLEAQEEDIENTETPEENSEEAEPLEENAEETEDALPSLKEAYQDYFDIGVCINPAVVAGKGYANLVLDQFSSVTCENNLKPESILKKAKSENERLAVDMSSAKSELEFASSNGLKMRGHTIIWHSQTPDWIFYEDYDTNGKLASRELMLTRMENYIQDVFTWASDNYPDMFYAWDVVNEAIDDNGKLRDSLWAQTIGDDYVEQAFMFARKYAPENIKLFYNDYNSFELNKKNAIIELLRPIAEAGNIDGVGMQGHLYTGEKADHFARSAKQYHEELGVIIHVTEIDVNMPSADGEVAQGRYYGQLFRALKDAKAAGVPIESVSVWGLTDDLSWKAKDKPLLFNKDLTPKSAFDEIIKAADIGAE